jgi:nucleoside-diphosphate-sugar epimerase
VSVLVTGGAGFLGARLVRRLAARSQPVHLIVRSTTPLHRIDDIVGTVQLHVCDLTDEKAVQALLRRIEPRTVFHIAATGAYGVEGPAQLFRDNALATYHLLRAAAPMRSCRFIHTASSLEPGPRDQPIREDFPFAPAVPYGSMKAASTLLARLAAAHGQPVVMLRPFAIYGPGEPARRLIPTAIRAARTGTPLPLTARGYTRDLVYVDDVVDAYVAASETEGIEGELINIATGRATSNEEVIRVVERAVGRPIAIETGAYPARPTDTALWCADVTKARRLLGWTAAHDLPGGIAATLADTHDPDTCA